jgi:hypothetical protein
LCGEKVSEEDMLEKTFSTFHASNVLLQQQYREKGFKKYSDLISCLLVAEQNNEFLMKNHEVRPTGAAPFPEVDEQHMTTIDKLEVMVVAMVVVMDKVVAVVIIMAVVILRI